MKFLIWILCLLGSTVINSLIRVADLPYTLAKLLLTGQDADAVALFAGALSLTFVIATWGFAIFLAVRLCKRWDKRSITKRASKAGLTDFQYARSTADPEIIAYCESHLHLSPDEITEYIQHQADLGKLKSNSAKVLIRVYSQNAGRPAPAPETEYSDNK